MEIRNGCAGPFGAFYDFMIERERFARVFGWAMWGIDTRPFYSSIEEIRRVPDGSA